MTGDIDIEELCRGTIGVYERQATHWDQTRDQSLYERVWLDRLTDGLPADAAVLDLGCGAGRPVAAHLVALGFDVTGVDASAPMIELAQQNVPSARFRVADMRSLDQEGIFHAIVSWDAFFHLSPEDQRDLLPKLADWVKPKGRLMMTVGPAEGTALGTVGGETVYHGSLDRAEYERLLTASGFGHVELHLEDARVKTRSVLLAAEKA